MKGIQTSIAVLATVTCMGVLGFTDALQAGDARTKTKATTVQMPGGMTNGGSMREMMKQMMPDMVPPGVKPQDLPDPNSRGAVLLVSYCTQCHDLPSPAMHSSQEWPRIAGRMFLRISRMSEKTRAIWMNISMPAPQDQKTIVAYLQMHAMKAISPQAVPSPGTRGAAVFEKKCSGCHALPDPKAHSAHEWPKIVQKMQFFMHSMNKGALSENERKDIVNYLTSSAGGQAPGPK